MRLFGAAPGTRVRQRLQKDAVPFKELYEGAALELQQSRIVAASQRAEIEKLQAELEREKSRGLWARAKKLLFGGRG
jgi:hypothetical protein